MKYFLRLAVAAIFLLSSGSVFAQSALKDIAKRNDVNAGQTASTAALGRLGNVDLSDDLINKVLPDLQYAAALAKQNNNKITGPCLDALLALVQGWQTPVKDASGNTLTLPDPHLITGMERQAELLNQIQPDSSLSLGCAAMNNAIKKDILTLVGTILSGGALGLFKLPIIP